MIAVKRGKRMHQVCARIDEGTLDELDRYMRERESATRIPMSRSLAMLELLERWAEDRAADRARVDRKETAGHG